MSNINGNIGGGKAVLSGVFKTKIEGQSIDDSSIILTVQNLDLIHNGGVLNSSDFYINSFKNKGIRNFSIINSSWFSGEAIGRFDLSKMDLLINNALSENFPIIPNSKALKNQNVKFEFRLSKDLVNILNTDLQSTEDFKLLGLLSSDKNISYLDIEVPFFQYQDFFAQGLKVNLNNKSSDRFSELIINKAIYKNTNLGEFTLGTKINNKKLSLNFKLKPSEIGGDKFNLTFEINKLSENKSIFHLSDSYIYFNSNRWLIKDNELQSVIFDNISNSFTINNLKINSNVSEINLNGYYQDKNKFDINLNIQNTNFNQIFKQNDNFTTNGIFNSNIEIKRTKTDNSFRGFIKSSNLSVNKVLVGDLDLSVIGNTQLNSYSINWNVFKDKKNTFLGIGNYIYDKSSSKLDLDISFSDFDISFSSPLGKKSISNIRGYLNGDLNIWGDLNDLQNTGSITLKRAGFSIPYLNTSYSLSLIHI